MEERCEIIPFADCYEVSTTGKVKRIRTKTGKVVSKLVKPYLTNDNRYSVTISKDGKTKTYRIHSLVLEVFVCPRPENLMARHLNGDCHDNSLENLKWGNQQRKLRRFS